MVTVAGDPGGVAAGAASDAEVGDPTLLGNYLRNWRPSPAEGRDWMRPSLHGFSRLGERAADVGVELRALVDLYLSATWRMWRLLPGVAAGAGAGAQGADRAAGAAVPDLTTIGEAVLHAADDAVAAATEDTRRRAGRPFGGRGAARREFLDDLLTGSSDQALLAERAEVLGLPLTGPRVVVVSPRRRAALPRGHRGGRRRDPAGHGGRRGPRLGGVDP